jgi:3',5'-cyclic AMP phosphodiesterase CpdA
VTLILHLSDIHLGGAPEEEIADDYKAEFVPLEERLARHRILAWTLEDLPRVLDEPLNALVISGDVTVADREDGFEQLEDILAQLGDARPPAERTMVVPGNHDVTWHTPPSSNERYRNFLNHIRGAGYVTPLLDGVDIDSEGKLIGDPNLPHAIADTEGWILLPFNSSNYSGSTEPLPDLPAEKWDEWVEWARREISQEAAAALQRLRTYDAARVSPGQLEALRRVLRETERDVEGGLPFRIGVIHHHLLPVSAREEVKSYESITNLGLLRNFLRENRLTAVLHGHKHREYIYRDHVYPPNGLPSGDPHPVLVVAGATIGTVDWDQGMVGRLIRIDSARAAPHVSVATIAGKDPGGALDAPRYSAIPLWRRSEEVIRADSPQFVDGETFDETYARLRSLFAERNQLRNVVCVIRKGNTADRLPNAYPEVPDVPAETRQEWFSDIVQWWQKTDSRLSERLHFTHGGRIIRGTIDQIEDAAAAFQNDPNTTRGVVTLLDPVRDEVKNPRRKYPAFCLVQLVGREQGSQVLVDCIGYFRKQQMRYWWPVNVGELRHIQKLVLNELGGANSRFRAGALWTVTALAVEGNTIPRVAVPAIDRIFDEDENELWSMAYAVAWEAMEGRSERIQTLAKLLEELIPEEDFDPDGVPVASEGLSYLADTLERLATHHQDSRASALATTLQNLYRVNAEYDAATAERVTRGAHDDWRGKVIPLIEEARGILEPLANGAGP